jgi:hypothetical protein
MQPVIVAATPIAMTATRADVAYALMPRSRCENAETRPNN